MLKNIFKIFSFFIIGMIGGIFSTQIFWPYFIERPLFLKYNLERVPIYITEKKEIYIQENQALQEVIKKVSTSVVKIKSSKEEGAGVIVTSDGLILTLSKIIPHNISNVFVIIGGKSFLAEILKKGKDFTLLKIKKENLKTVPFSNEEKISLGKRIFYLGITGGKLIANEGVIKSFKGEKIITNLIEKEKIEGAPLFNIKGELVGQIEISPEKEVSAISINKIKDFLGF